MVRHILSMQIQVGCSTPGNHSNEKFPVTDIETFLLSSKPQKKGEKYSQKKSVEESEKKN